MIELELKIVSALLFLPSSDKCASFNSLFSGDYQHKFKHHNHGLV